MYLKPSEIKYSAALLQFAQPMQRCKSVCDFAGQRGRNIRRMMRRKYSLRIQGFHLFRRAHKRKWVGRRIKGVQAPLINQIPGIQPPSVRLIETAVPGRMTGRMDDLQRSIS